MQYVTNTQYIFLSLYSGYKCLGTNELCSDYGLIQVCYPDECRDQAAKFCGVDDYPFDIIRKPNVPSGCHVFGKELFHNTLLHGGDRHPNAAPICWA